MRGAGICGALVASLAMAGPLSSARADTYVLRPGDTLSHVAAAHGVTVADLARANQVADPDHVRAGKAIVVPGAGAGRPQVAEKAAPARRGYDISFPQCWTALPTDAAFGILGVNGGRPYTANPCFGPSHGPAQLAWAMRTANRRPNFYANTANPGPRGLHWPTGHTAPRPCLGTGTPVDCAYDYGYEAAHDALARARSHAGSAARAQWWLDVETTNSWSTTDLASNLASIRGSLDYLRGQGASVGIYSTRYQWTVITGGAPLPSVPTWVAGVGSLASARRSCSPAASFTGGRVLLVQYSADGFDADHHC